MRQRARPVAAPHPLRLEGNVAPRRDDQGEGELGGRVGGVALAGRHRNAERRARLEIDGAGVPADQRQELEPGQALEQRARELDPLADRNDDVGVAQPLDELVEVAGRRTVAHDIVGADERIAGELVDHVLVVVGNYDFHLSSVFLEQGRTGETRVQGGSGP